MESFCVPFYALKPDLRIIPTVKNRVTVQYYT